MRTLAAIALSLPLSQIGTPAPPSKELLDARWIPSMGVVEVSTVEGRRLEVVARKFGGPEAIEQPQLDWPLPGSRILAARSSQFLGEQGLAIGLAVLHQGVVSYHYLLHRDLLPGSDSDAKWQVSDAIFTSTGDPYRISDVHCAGGDQIEITFRRGFLRAGRDGKPLDEKIFVNDCPGTDPFTGGKLFETSIANAITDPVPRKK